MTRITLTRTLAAAIIASLALTACKKNEPAPAPAPTIEPAAPAPAPTAPAAASASVASVDLGSAVGADGRVTTPSAVFAPTDVIYASVGTNTSDPAANVAGKLGAKWTHVDSGTQVFDETKDFALAGPGVTTFQISKPDGWPTGKYKVDVSLDGAVVQSREFEVR